VVRALGVILSFEHINSGLAVLVAVCGAVWSIGSVSSKADVALEKAISSEESRVRLDDKLDRLIEEVGKIKTNVAVVRAKVESIDSVVTPKGTKPN